MISNYLQLINCLVILLIGCTEHKSNKHNVCNVEIACNKVLVADTLFNPTFGFILDIKNTGISDRLFFNNYIFEDSFQKAGFFLEDTIISGLQIQIGSTLHSETFIVKAGKSRKLLLVYTNIVTDSIARNKFENMTSVYRAQIKDNWFDTFVTNVQLSYKHCISDNAIVEVHHADDDYIVIKDNISIRKKLPEVLYFEKLTTEEANRFVVE